VATATVLLVDWAAPDEADAVVVDAEASVLVSPVEKPCSLTLEAVDV
jgi:hypothetical protein